MMVQVAHAPGVERCAAQELFHFLDSTLPALQKLLNAAPETILIVSAPDPMWHGGISGDQSFFMHADRPLRTPDKTSPYLHELFHVLQPYKPAADADWIEEGLAEFYSLELQRRAGLIDAAAYTRALGYFERYGLWNVDLTQQQDNAATNNSAPLVMYALDQRIQRATAGKTRLDDVVTRLATRGGEVDTDRFRRDRQRRQRQEVHQVLRPPRRAGPPAGHRGWTVVAPAAPRLARFNCARYACRAGGRPPMYLDTASLELLAIVVLILANGFFSAAEISIVAVRKSRLAQLISDGRTVANVVVALKDDPSRFLATVQIGVTVVSSMASVIGGAAAVRYLEPLVRAALPEVLSQWAEAIALSTTVVLISYFTLVLGELVPKSLALRAQRTAGLSGGTPDQPALAAGASAGEGC